MVDFECKMIKTINLKDRSLEIKRRIAVVK